MQALAGFVCPLTHVIMQDPVMTVDGTSYERTAIEQHFIQRHARGGVFMTNPLTNAILIDTQLIPNHALRFAIHAWLLDNLTLSSQEKESAVFYIPIPTVAINAVSSAAVSLRPTCQIDIEHDDGAIDFGVRLVTLKAQDSAMAAQAKFKLWTVVQKQFRADDMWFDKITGLPYTQLDFTVPHAKIGRILAKEYKRKMERKFRVSLLVERSASMHRRGILTAWNSNHENVPAALEACREFILSKLV